jgi:hypothetical protein
MTEIINLIDLIRNLLGRKAELDKNYFEQFIKPTWEIFDLIHADYMKSLREYTEMLLNENNEIEMIIRKIGQDSIYTASMRTELYTMIQNLPDSHLKTKEKYLLDFVASIIEYFLNRDVVVSKKDKEVLELFYDHNTAVMRSKSGISIFASPEQWVRRALMIYLKKKGVRNNREDTGAFFDYVALSLQMKYKKIALRYNRLKTDLLT